MSSDNVIIRLMLSLWQWPKVITLRGLHCSYKLHQFFYSYKSAKNLLKTSSIFLQLQISSPFRQESLRVGLFPQSDNGLQSISSAPVVRKRPKLTSRLAKERPQHPGVAEKTWWWKRWSWFVNVESFGQSTTKYSLGKQFTTASTYSVKSKSI